MINGEYLLIKPSFLLDYAKNRFACQKAGDSHDYKSFLSDRFDEAFRLSQDIYSFDGTNATIRIFGPLSVKGPDAWDIYSGLGGCSYNNIIESAIRAAHDVDADMGEVFVDMNTAGGTVDGCDSAFQALWQLSLTHKITFRNHGMICSAGVWLSSAGHKVEAVTPAAIHGSIGVVLNTFDFSGMLEEFGVEEIVITNFESPDKVPDLKTEKGKEIVREELDDLYNVFVGRVLQGRNRDGQKVTGAIINNMKGRVAIAAKAVNLGLVDAINEKAEPLAAGVNDVDIPEVRSDIDQGILKIEKKDEKENEFNREGSMKLAELFGKYPDAEKEHQVALASAKEEGASAVREVAKTATVFLMSPDYPAAVKDLAAKTITGEIDAIALTSAVSAFDAVKEQAASASAQQEPVVETPADGAVITSGGDGKVVDQQSYDDNVSALKKFQGIK